MNKNLSVLIVDDDERYAKSLASYMNKSKEFLSVSYELNGEAGLEAALFLKPDVIILDIIMPRLDGIGLLRRFKAAYDTQKPIVIINTMSNMFENVSKVIKSDVSYFMAKPQSPEFICETIRELSSLGETTAISLPNSPKIELESQVSELLRHLGIPAHIAGYRYIRSAIIHALDDIEILSPITKNLYPALAKEFRTTKSGVERCIRHAISVSWSRGDKKMLCNVFGYSPDALNSRHPTNAEYLAMITDDFRLHLQHRTIIQD